MKSLAIIPALLIGATSVSAAPVDPGFGQHVITVNRSGAATIRACAEDFGGPYSAVCYNQTTTVSVDGGRFKRSTERVVRVSCDVPHTSATTRGQVAAEFCPLVLEGTLAPAPFLL